MQEMWVRSLGWEDALEEGMATHSSVLGWRVPWTEEPGGQRPQGCRESDTTEATWRAHTGLHFNGVLHPTFPFVNLTTFVKTAHHALFAAGDVELKPEYRLSRSS